MRYYSAHVIPYKVEREIVIAALVEVVWQMLTEPAQMARWFADEVELDPTPGGEGQLRFEQREPVALRVEAVEPMRRFAFRWAGPGSPRPSEPEAMLVEFTLRDEAGATRLKVVESGFARVDWSDAEKARYAEDHGQGWGMYLGRMRDLHGETAP